MKALNWQSNLTLYAGQPSLISHSQASQLKPIFNNQASQPSLINNIQASQIVAIPP